MPTKHASKPEVATPTHQDTKVRKVAPGNIKKQAAQSKKRSVLGVEMSEREKTKRSLEKAFCDPKVRAEASKALEALTRF